MANTPGPVSAEREKFQNLNGFERWWRDRSNYLEHHGYRLRPRLRPGWVPSWHVIDKRAVECEDSRFAMVAGVMDATRLSDGRAVALKRVGYDADELMLTQMLTSDEAKKNPMNHCVPVLGYIGAWRTPGPTFIVMPLLHNFDEPEFDAVDDVMDFIQQTLEGLVYIHRMGVAHRDLTGRNIMMDGDALYPDGSHTDPSWRYLLPDRNTMARTLTRSEVGKVKYYIIDFGISSYFEDPTEPHLVTGIDGIDQEVPELSLTEPYDPFAVDIFTTGNTYRKYFRKYKNLLFLKRLIEGMTNPDPSERPTAEEALSCFEELRASVRPDLLRQQLRPQNEPIIIRYIHEISDISSLLSSALRKVLTPMNVLYVAIPVGASMLILFRGHRRIYNRVCSLITHFLLRSRR